MPIDTIMALAKSCRVCSTSFAATAIFFQASSNAARMKFAIVSLEVV
jgi:hypothetical protein